jgi:Zn-dependent protease with chaperone function
MERAEAANASTGPYRQPPPGPSPGFGQSWTRTIVEILVVVAAIALLLVGARGCAGCAASVIVSSLPADVDEAIGKAGGESMRAEHKMSEPPTAEQSARVLRIFDELRKGLKEDEAKILISPRVTTVTDTQVNAFALPGGEVFVLTGLLDRVKDDDDLLRGVLAHELGHAVHRHGVRSLVRNSVYGLAIAFVMGDLDTLTATLVAGASQLDRLSYSRSMEEEADQFGVDLLLRIGKDPEGLARFLESLESVPVPELLSTHPDSKERAKAIRERLKDRKK